MIAGAAALFSSPSEATAASFAHLETCLAHRFRKAERKPAAGKGSRGLRLTPPKPYGPMMARTFNWPIFRSEEHTSELQSLMRTSSAVFCLQQKQDYIKH